MIDPYKYFKLDKSVLTLEILNKKYKKLCLKYHPDRGGDNKKFAKIVNSYNYIKNDLEISINEYDYNYKNNNKITITESSKKINKKKKDILDGEKSHIGYENIYLDKNNLDLKLFNKIFEENKIKDYCDNGYGNLMENSDNQIRENIDIKRNDVNNYNFNEKFNENNKNDKIKIYKEPEYIKWTNNTTYELGIDKMDDYSSGINTKLHYGDFKRVHIDETHLINKDLIDRPQITRNINSYQQERDTQNFELTDNDIQYYQNKKILEDNMELNRQTRVRKTDNKIAENFNILNRLMIK